MKKIILYITGILVITGMLACEPEFTNPASATEEQALNNADALIALANGLQARYTTSRQSNVYNAITASGLSTRELTNLNAGNTGEELLRIGGANVQGNNNVVTNLWTSSHLVRAHADLIISRIDVAKDPNVRSGILAHATIMRALALGDLAMFWEKSPIVTATNAEFKSREEVLRDAIASLEKALAEVKAKTPSVNYTGKAVTGIDFTNTCNALIARYSIMLGNNQKAIDAANAVDLTKRSFFAHDDISRNAFFETSTSNRNVCEPINAKPKLMGLPDSVNVNDKRIAFFINTTASTNLGRASFFTANTASVPVYRSGEMILIKAEAFARQDKLPEAKAELDKILTKKGATDVWGIGADLPAYSGADTKDAILYEIYRQRCLELYLSGMKLEDSRRFGRPAPGTPNAERTRNFYPYPFTERDNNKSTPADPAI
jgi:starch-binding outer membrane protein, SusD/RagB family